MVITMFQQKQVSENLPARQREFVISTFAKAGDQHIPPTLAARPHQPSLGPLSGTQDFLHIVVLRCPLHDSVVSLFTYPVGGSSRTAATTAQETTTGKGWQPAQDLPAVEDFFKDMSNLGRSLPAPAYLLPQLPSTAS